MKIVTADRDLILLELIRPHIRDISPDCDLVEVTSSKDLIKVAEKEEAALYVLGLAPREIINCVSFLRKTRPAAKIVIFSSACDARSIRQMIEAGVDGYVPKSFKVSAFQAALRLVLDGETFIPSVAIEEEVHPEATSDKEMPRLTPMEIKIGSLLRFGLSNKHIARKLSISEATVKTHLTNLFHKLRARNRAQASHSFSNFMGNSIEMDDDWGDFSSLPGMTTLPYAVPTGD